MGDTELSKDIGEAVALAVEQHKVWARGPDGEDEWARFKESITPIQPRVLVQDGGRPVLRRPFRRKGLDGETRWVTRWFGGFTRLSCPERNEHGRIVFKASWV